MSSRKLNADELKLHQAALATNDQTVSLKEAEKLVPDGPARTAAINFLLGAGMFKVMTSAGGVSAFRAVMKKEMDVKKDMSGEEAMVLSHIQASRNEGIWTKHLKAKTELHQTVIDRCLKSLVQKQLVKSIKAVRHPTRKIYMLAHLEPSVELTGGPWYTDNELDTEFIKLLSTACLHYIRDRSFPKQPGKSGKRSSQSQQRLYAIGAAPSYPSAQQIQHFLSKSKITETELGVEHIEMLLRVLELDGEIEKIPAFAASAWDATVASETSDSDTASSSEENDGGRSSSKKRKRDLSKRKRKDSSKRKRRRMGNSEEDSDSENERSKSKKKKKRTRKDDDSDEQSSDAPKAKKKRKSKKSDDSDSGSEGEESDEEVQKKKKRKGKSKKRDDSSSEGSDPGSQSESEDERLRSKSKSKSRSSSKKASSSQTFFVKRRKSASPDLNDTFTGGAFVYRATKQERVVLGWSQAPCGRCPVFDFCQVQGPTNPQECVYYEEWYTLGAGAQKAAVPAAMKVEM
ncbi:hypothetical protein BS17DRAFT_778990 [Gyrodon lividus]|nr:hypothetical protein BS17DRAFT_778990 [Gyrodon lividus]